MRFGACLCRSGLSADRCVIHRAPAPVLLLPVSLAELAAPRRWHHVEKLSHGMLVDVSMTLVQMETDDGDAFPDLRDSDNIFVVSDYAGHHNKRARYELFAFLLVDPYRWAAWESQRLALRQSVLTGRTMSFKGLHDGVKRRAMPQFLSAADYIRGALFVFAIHKGHASLFSRDTKLDMKSPELLPFSHWRPAAFEKLLRSTHFLSFLVAALSREGQQILWYSDEDDIAPNSGATDRNRTGELGQLWRTILPNYTPHRIPQIIIGTEKDDDETCSLSDFLAIPDLAAGAWCELFSLVNGTDFGLPTPRLSEAINGLRSDVLQILYWFSQRGTTLKRILCIIEQPVDGRVEFICSSGQRLGGFRREIDTALLDRKTSRRAD